MMRLVPAQNGHLLSLLVEVCPLRSKLAKVVMCGDISTVFLSAVNSHSMLACLRVLAMPDTVRPTYDGAVQAEFWRCELPPHLLVAIWAASCSLHAPAGPSLGFLRSTCPSPGEDAPSPGRPGR